MYADFSGGEVSSITLYSELGYKTDGAITQKDVSNAILNNNLGEKEYVIDNFEYGYILNSEGVKTATDTNWGVSEFIECNDKIFKIKTIAKNNNPCFCFYSSNNESSFIKAIYGQDDILVLGNTMKSFDSLINIPAGANYIRVVCNKYNDSVINNYRVFKYYNPIKYELNEFKNNAFELLTSDNKKEITDTDILLKNKGYRLQTNGSILEDSKWWVVSEYIKIEIGTIVTAYCASNSPCIAIYDENKDFIMSYNPDTIEGNIMKKTIDISEYVGGYVRLQSNTTFNLIAKFEYDATLKDDINSIKKEIAVGNSNKLPYQSGNIYFSVKINKDFPTNGTTQTCEDTETLADIPCVLKLPATYTQNGTPTKLIMTCHGAGGSVSNNSISSAGGHECIINGGFAWFDVNGSCDNSEHMSGIRALEAYKKAYDYIIKNYNIDPNILVHGRSMGGLTALNFTYHFPSIVSACACVYPVTDLYNQAWLRPWSSTCKQNMAIEYNFNDKTGNAFEEDKVIGFNPIKNNTFTISDNAYTNFPVPLKIWHGLADTTVRIDESRKLVSAIKNYGGRASIREIEGMAHTLSDWLWNETFIWLKRYS